MVVFLLSLGVFLGYDLLGFGAKVGTWTDFSKAITPVATSFKWMPAWRGPTASSWALSMFLAAP